MKTIPFVPVDVVPRYPAPLDLRGQTREPERFLTVVRLCSPFGRSVDWLTFGQGELSRIGDDWRLTARLAFGATDEEHDSGYALCLPLAGVVFGSATYGRVFVRAVITAGRSDVFRVPSGDPLAGAAVCRECEKEHPIVPFFPPEDEALYARMVGRVVEVEFSAP